MSLDIKDATGTTKSLATGSGDGSGTPFKSPAAVGIGDVADAAVTNPASSGSLVALLKGIITKLAAALTVKPSPVAVSTANCNVPGSTNSAATITLSAAGAGVCNILPGIAWSYSGGTPTGRLTIQDGSGNYVFDEDITAAGAGTHVFPRAMKGTANTAMIVTLAAAGSSVQGKLNLLTPYTE